jgi:hypothetical protein
VSLIENAVLWKWGRVPNQDFRRKMMPQREAFPLIFTHLKLIFEPFVPPLIVQADTSDNYSLVIPASARYPTGLFVGAVQVKKNYVSFHLMPIYMFPELLSGLSVPLRKRMQGKSCFNFIAVDETLFAELQQLTHESIAYVREKMSVNTEKGV